jgi:hypothetical protein
MVRRRTAFFPQQFIGQHCRHPARENTAIRQELRGTTLGVAVALSKPLFPAELLLATDTRRSSPSSRPQTKLRHQPVEGCNVRCRSNSEEVLMHVFAARSLHRAGRWSESGPMHGSPFHSARVGLGVLPTKIPKAAEARWLKPNSRASLGRTWLLGISADADVQLCAPIRAVADGLQPSTTTTMASNA